MSHTKEDFLKMIAVADPDDDLVRLGFADWLENQGDKASIDRAEFIRIQIELKSSNLDEKKRAELEKEEKKLLEIYGIEWAEELGGGVSYREVIDNAYLRPVFFKGLPNTIEKCLEANTFPIFQSEIEANPQWAELAPITILYVEIDKINEFLNNPVVPRLRKLEITSANETGDSIAIAIAESESLKCLEKLTIREGTVGNRGAEALAFSKCLPCLNTLDIRPNNIGVPGTNALFDKDSITWQLYELKLGHAKIHSVVELMESVEDPDSPMFGFSYDDKVLNFYRETLPQRKIQKSTPVSDIVNKGKLPFNQQHGSNTPDYGQKGM